MINDQRLSKRTTNNIMGASNIPQPERRIGPVQKSVRVIAAAGALAAGGWFLKVNSSPPSTEATITFSTSVNNQEAAQEVLDALREPNQDVRPIMGALANAEANDYSPSDSVPGNLPLRNVNIPYVKLDPNHELKADNVIIQPDK